MSEQSENNLTVYYDGACPLCRIEIDHYRGIDRKRAICFVDARGDGIKFPAGLTQETAFTRLYARCGDGTIFSGAAAFIAIWAHLPGWHIAAKLRHIPGMMWMMERAYIVTLYVRPWLVRRLFTKSHHV